jgi:pimeloyl-ACP methyl ester carboxylesterase
MRGELAEGWPKFASEEGRARYLAAYDAAVRAWPVPYQELDIETRLGPTHVVASGREDAPPLILAPSFAGTPSVWRANAEALGRHFRIYAIDVIGQPGRSRALRKLEGRRDYADWLTDVMDGLGVARASIVGCSFGGFLALSQAALTPDRVDRVALIGPAGCFKSLSWRLVLRMRTARWRRWLKGLIGLSSEPDPRTLHARKAPLHPEDDAWRTLMGVTMAERAEVSITNADVLGRAELRAIRAPALLLIGEYEMLYEPKATLKLARRLMPQLQGEIVEGADHVAAMAQPEAVNARLLAFLQGSAS